MGSSVVNIKADEPNDGSTAQRVDKSHGTTARIKSFDQRSTAAYLLGRLLWMRIKHSHQKITMTHTQTTSPNRIALRESKKGARPAEFGALAPVFEKSATELKLKQKLLKSKSTIQIATFNVRTLNRIGQLAELATSAIDHNIDNMHTKIQIPSFLVSASAWKSSVDAVIGGVCMLIGLQPLKSLNSIEKIQPRMMVATFNVNPSTTIISCYGPTYVGDETDLIAFYNELSSLVRRIPKHSVFFIGGDMNA